MDHCYLCDMCFMSKCPYVPPHPWNIDFPHLMLRAKAHRLQKDGASVRDRILSSTDRVGNLAGIPVVAQTVNAVNRSKTGRKLLAAVLGVHRDAILPPYASKSLRSRVDANDGSLPDAEPTDATRGRVILFGSCYGNRNEPAIGENLARVFEHNGIPVRLPPREKCCGMPKLELGDLKAVDQLKSVNISILKRLVAEGWDIVAPVPSCVLMFKQELPLMYPDDEAVQAVKARIFDPFEYLALRHRAGKLTTDFNRPLGKVAYHVACHLRVPNIGLKTGEILNLIPDTTVQAIERCSGHDGTYAAKTECHEISMKIERPVVRQVAAAEADYYSSDCPMAGHQIENGLGNGESPTHPLTLLRMAYGL